MLLFLVAHAHMARAALDWGNSGAALLLLYLLSVIGGYVGGKTGLSTTDLQQSATDWH